MVSTFAGASGKLTPPMNKLSARIIPSSQYVQAGTPFSADVFLSATSSHFTDDNIQFILGDVDTTTGVLKEGAVVLPVDNGNGKISIPTSGSGHKDIHGWIKFKDGNGMNKYYRYDNEYVVASAAAAVSADKMNVMYIGVENPISVSAAGVAPTDLQVSISGCGGSLVNSGNGKYNAKVTSTGTCMVTVMAKTATGMKAQGPPQPFRVKKLPNPPLKIAGIATLGSLDMKANVAKTINALGLDNGGFDFQTTSKVTEFSMMVVAGGVGGSTIKCMGSQLSPAAIGALKNLKAGNKIYFEDIKIQVAGEIRDFPPARVLVR
jgi:gliding motility-associated protein GldM